MTKMDPEATYEKLEGDSKPVLHVRFEGSSRDIPIDLLDVGPRSTDQAVRDAVARYLDINAEQLRSYVVEHHPNGNMTLRPEAVFG
jgi:hypothetical protein